MIRKYRMLLMVAFFSWAIQAKADVSNVDLLDTQSASVDSVAMMDSIFQKIEQEAAVAIGVNPELIKYIDLSEDGHFLAVKYYYEVQVKKKTMYEVGVAALEMSTHTVLWDMKRLPVSVMLACTQNGMLMLTPYGKTRMFDYMSGQEKWELKAPFLPCYLTKDHIVGYRNLQTNELWGISLSTGEKNWKTSVDHASGWSMAQMIDESNLYIVADDLHRINLQTGENHKLKCKASITDKKRFWGSIALGVATGVTTGVAILPGRDQSINAARTIFPVPSDGLHISGLCSNILVDGEKNYFADRHSMYCFDSGMNILWEVELPDDRSAGSALIERGDTIVMINLGRALRAGEDTYGSGTPYVALFNKANGEVLSFESFAKNKEFVLDYKVDEYGVYLVTEHNLIYKPYDGEMTVKER